MSWFTDTFPVLSTVAVLFFSVLIMMDYYLVKFLIVNRPGNDLFMIINQANKYYFSGYFINWSISLKEVTIPLIIAELKPLCSISFKPAMVQPRGVVTLSISFSG